MNRTITLGKFIMEKLLWEKRRNRLNQSSPEINREIFLGKGSWSQRRKEWRAESRKKREKEKKKEKKICNLLLTRPIPPGRNAIMQSNEIVAYAWAPYPRSLPPFLPPPPPLHILCTSVFTESSFVSVDSMLSQTLNKLLTTRGLSSKPCSIP